MKRSLAAIVALALAASPAFAKNEGKGKSNAPGQLKKAAKVEAKTPGQANKAVRVGKKTVLLDCPPGLRTKNVPCVPPGLANKGVDTDAWLNREPGEIADMIRDDVKDRDDRDDGLFLDSDEIADLFGLDPAPDGQSYAVIDGQVLLVDDDLRRDLRRLGDLAAVTDLDAETVIIPELALSQSELIEAYNLPEPAEGRYYSVVDGAILDVNERSYDLLQTIRLIAAIS